MRPGNQSINRFSFANFSINRWNLRNETDGCTPGSNKIYMSNDKKTKHRISIDIFSWNDE